MENTDFGDLNSSSTPFILSLMHIGSNMSNFVLNQNIGQCSAGCYQAFTSGQQTVSDRWCDSNPPCLATGSGVSNLANQLNAAGLTSAMFCEDGCPRHADHFPWLGYSNTYNSCVSSSSFTTNCSGQTGSAGDALYNTIDALGANTAYTSFQANAGNTAFINYLNSASPANYIWFTPTDCHNMHDLCGQSRHAPNGDFYLGSLLCGCSSWTGSNAASGTVFASSLWQAGHTILYLWWDEPRTTAPIANLVYGIGIKSGYTSSTSFGHYNSVHTIERNWGLSYITPVVSGDTSLTDIFVPALVAIGPGSVTQCDMCTRTLTYMLYTVDLSGTATYSSNAPGTVVFTPLSGTTSMALDDKLIVSMQWTLTGFCGTGQITTTFTVNGVSSQFSTHVNCATKPGP